MIIISHSCEFCRHKFYAKIGTTTLEEERKEKYDHLRGHSEFFDKVKFIVERYPTIKRLIPMQSSKYSTKGTIHHIVDIIYDSENDIRFQQILVKFDRLLLGYGELLENIEKNIVKRKALNNVFSFLAELEVFEAVKKTFGSNPEIRKSDNDLNIDFVYKNIIFEVKCPLETSKTLSDYISDWKQQRQLKHYKNDRVCVLVVKTDYIYPDFPIISGGISRILTENKKNLFWNCCITYNSSNKKKDVEVITILDDCDKENFNTMAKKLLEG